MTTQTYTASGLWRRLAACLYDNVLLFGIQFFLALPITILFEKATGVPLFQHAAYNVYLVFIYLVSFIYYGWFWTHPGQTLGMKAWKLTLQSQDGGRITWFQALLRYIGAAISLAAFGLGFLWGALPRKNTWHDLLSGSRLLTQPSTASKDR